MTSFASDKYNPADDSSAAHTERAHEDGVVVLEQAAPTDEGKTAGCLDGCAQETAKGRSFRQGHDQRLRGILQRAGATQTTIVLVGPDGGERRVSALGYAGELDANRIGHLGWADSVTRAQNAEQAKVEARATRAQAREAKAAQKAREADAKGSTDAKPEPEAATDPAQDAEPTIVSEGTAKHGRWTYPARTWSDGRTERNEKRNGQGAWVAV